MWLADDGKVPTYLPFLTPKLASQITQIWAVSLDVFRTPQQIRRSLPPMEEPDYDPPLHPSPNKKATTPMSPTLADRSLTGTGQEMGTFTFSWKPIWTNNVIKRYASTSGSEAAQLLAQQPP